EEMRRNATMSADERALFDAKAELDNQLIDSEAKVVSSSRGASSARSALSAWGALSAANISSTELVVFGFNPTDINLGSDSDSDGDETDSDNETFCIRVESDKEDASIIPDSLTIGSMIKSVSEVIIAASTEAVISASTEAVISASTEEVTKSPTLQDCINGYQELKDCHRRIEDILLLIRSYRLFSEEFLNRIHIIKLYLMSNEQHASSDILHEINAYPARTFRVFRNGISSVYELEEFFGHSVLGWQDHQTGEWFILDFLFMPISDVGYGMPLIHYLNLVVHNDARPVIIVPVVRHPSTFRQTCLDAVRLRNTIEGVVDSTKNEVYPDIAELYKGDILREEP
ncbi:hypothetical protein EBS02_10075, partial [bacterium]|nr:hypothetical protein [bacterium]